MRDEEDRLIDVLLDRVLGGHRPPDLVGKVVARAYPRRRRILWWAAGAAVVLAVAACLFLVARSRGGYPAPQADGRTLARDTLITTGDEPATLALGGYCRIRIEPASRLRIEGAERAEAIFLVEGGVACEVDRRVGSFAVRTRACTVSATGTRFAVRILDTKPDERVFVSVQDGSVLVAGRGGERTLEAGQEFTSPAEAALPKEEAKQGVLPAKGPVPGERVTLTGMARALPPDARGERNPSAANATLAVTTTGPDGKEAEVIYDVAGWAGVILAKAGDGRKAEVSGVVSERDGKRTITGKSVDVKIIIVEEKPR